MSSSGLWDRQPHRDRVGATKKQKQYKNTPKKKKQNRDTRKNKNPKKRTQKEAAPEAPRSFLRFFFVVFDFFWCLQCVLFFFGGGSIFGVVFVFF